MDTRIKNERSIIETNLLIEANSNNTLWDIIGQPSFQKLQERIKMINKKEE